jgi:hypothetical protein
MSEFLETLKSRLQDSQKRMLAAQQKLAVAQAEFNSAAQETNSWNVAVMTETRKMQQDAAAEEPATAMGPSATEASQAATIAPAPDINKTELVRGVLRQHPSGVTPHEIAKELKMQVDKAYVYSILKRLKDKDEVVKRRGGKYCLKHPQQQSQPEEMAQNGIVVLQH